MSTDGQHDRVITLVCDMQTYTWWGIWVSPRLGPSRKSQHLACVSPCLSLLCVRTLWITTHFNSWPGKLHSASVSTTLACLKHAKPASTPVVLLLYARAVLTFQFVVQSKSFTPRGVKHLASDTIVVGFLQDHLNELPRDYARWCNNSVGWYDRPYYSQTPILGSI